MYLCDDGLPTAKSARFQGYDKMDSEYRNRDHRMRYTLMQPHGYYWSIYNPRIDWSGSEAERAAAQFKNYKPAGGTGYYPQKWSAERRVRRALGRHTTILSSAMPRCCSGYAEAKYEYDGKISDADLDISLNLTRCRVNASISEADQQLRRGPRT